MQDFFNIACNDLEIVKTTKRRKSIRVYNVAASFDIETSSFYDADKEKVALMYVWQFGINGQVIVGRTWAEFTEFIRQLQKRLCLGNGTYLYVYVHNLPFEFQHMKLYFKWDRIFATGAYEVLEAECGGVCYKCSLRLSNTSLEQVGKNLIWHDVKKMVGDLDYSKIRTPITPLSKEEMQYCINDVKVVMAYIEEEMKQNGDITKIPLTKTGYARRYTRQKCYGIDDEKQWWKWKKLMNVLRLDLKEYNELRRAFCGGFTHANFDYVGKIVENVDSIDLTSAYPYALCAYKFPMSKGRRIDKLTYEEFYNRLEKDCCVFDIEFNNICAKVHSDYYISKSKCYVCENAVTYNGRISKADRIRLTITDVDFDIISHFYKWDGKPKITNFICYKKDYLPKEIIEAVLQLYADKTQLKGVEGQEVNYMVSKGLLNAIYGMFVSRILIPCWTMDEMGLWHGEETGEDELIKNNNSRTRFSFYPWGVYTTAYIRRIIASGIMEFGDDYLYSDTDSLKVKNFEKHRKWVDKFNRQVSNRLEKMAKSRGIDMELFNPMDKNGNRHMLGVFDWETEKEKYRRFKTLGAKRYMIEKEHAIKIDGEWHDLSITVAGLNKFKTLPWMKKQWTNDECFEHFDEDLEVPDFATGKLTHTYINDERRGTVIDYMGNSYDYVCKSGVHLEGAGYCLSLEKEFAKLLKERMFTLNLERGYANA